MWHGSAFHSVVSNTNDPIPINIALGTGPVSMPSQSLQSSQQVSINKHNSKNVTDTHYDQFNKDLNIQMN